MTDHWLKKGPPAWAKDAKPTVNGWAHPKTGELLVAHIPVTQEVLDAHLGSPVTPAKQTIVEVPAGPTASQLTEIQPESELAPITEVQPEVDTPKEVKPKASNKAKNKA